MSIEELINFINDNNSIESVKDEILGLHEYDLAELFSKVSSEKRQDLYKLFNHEELASIFSYLDEDLAVELMSEIDDQSAAKIINEMEPDDAADILNEAEDEYKEDLIQLLDKDVRDDYLELEKYEEYTAGSVMNTHYISVLMGNDIKVAMKNLVSNAPNVESINTIFVIDENENLKGTIDLKKLIITKSPCLVDDIMDINFKSVDVDTDVEDATRIINEYDIFDLPVLEYGILRGIITVDDAMESVVDEAKEDYARLAGLTSDIDKSDTFIESILKRIPWLSILLVCDLFVPIISSFFDYIFNVPGLIVLVLFQPVVLGLAGNSSMQSLGIAIRTISNKMLEDKLSIIKHILKEMFTGMLLGLVLGIISFGITYVMLLITKASDIDIVLVSLSIGISTFIGLLFSNIVGSLIPIFFYKIKVDPATASGPFITTIIDIIAIVVYYLIATIIFKGLL